MKLEIVNGFLMNAHVQVAASPILFAILPLSLLVGMAWSLESVIPKNTMQLENAC